MRPIPPQRTEPQTSWEHHELWIRVRDALRALPDYFTSETNIEGMLATDIFSLNAPLGTTIEEQVVATLNLMRPVWDPTREYQTYSFVRQTQTFPDVLLRKQTDGQEVIMGIELKGWYLLAKEGMPSYRFTVSPGACTQADLLVVVPWVLSNVLSRNTLSRIDHLLSWHDMRPNIATTIGSMFGTRRMIDPSFLLKISDPIPSRAIGFPIRRQATAVATSDASHATGIMDEYMEETRGIVVKGIPAKDWSAFFKRHKEGV